MVVGVRCATNVMASFGNVDNGALHSRRERATKLCFLSHVAAARKRIIFWRETRTECRCVALAVLFHGHSPISPSINPR